MKTESKQLTHLTGEQAYLLFWQQVYKCRPRLSTVEILNLNLEIVVDENQTILAYRHDLPDDMIELVLNAGHWYVVNPDYLCPEVLNELNTLMGKLKKGICWN